MNLSVRMTGPQGLPLDAMSDIIRIRQQELGETAKDAIISTAINALKSIRSHTKVATARSASAQIEDTGWYGGFSNSTRKPCVRTGPSRTDSKVEGIQVKISDGLYQKGIQQRDRHVYKITPDHERVKPYYYMALNPTQALKHEMKRAKAQIGRTGGLARCVLGVAMMKLSTKEKERGTSDIQKALSKWNFWNCIVREGKDSTSVSVSDTLPYSISALRNGESSLAEALRASLSRTIGYINQVMKRTKDGFFKNRIENPFKADR